MSFMQIELSSGIVNFLNFLLFDVLLISFIFFFTADICGRLNYYSLLDGSTQPLVTVSPPLIGGGLCSTSKYRAQTMLFVRIVAVVLVFATAFTIDGQTIEQKEMKMEIVRVPGRFPKNVTRLQINNAAELQKSCQISTERFIYFGRLSEKGECETDKRLLQDQIRFEAAPQLINVSLTCERKVLDKNEKRTIYEYICPQQYSYVQCTQHNSLSLRPSDCHGVVQVQGSDFVCLAFKYKKKDSWTGSCRRAWNLRRADKFWKNATHLSNYNLLEIIGATNVMALKEQQVKYFQKKNVTFVNMIWFGFFAAKLALVAILFSISAFLRSMHLRCVLHDEHALMLLLRLNISHSIGLPNDEVSLYVHGSSSERRGKKSFWVSGRPQLRPMNVEANQLELERS